MYLFFFSSFCVGSFRVAERLSATFDTIVILAYVLFIFSVFLGGPRCFQYNFPVHRSSLVGRMI